MDGRQTMDVVEWIDAPHSVASQPHTLGRFSSPAIIGLAGTLLIHATAFQSLDFWGRPHKAHLPEIQAPGLSNHAQKTKPAETLVFVDLSETATGRNENDEALASVRAAIRKMPITISRPDPVSKVDVGALVIDEEKAAESSIGDRDGTEHERLLGIYSGQVLARIERIWSRPRTPVNEGNNPANTAGAVEYFHCQAQIVQDSSGNVQEVLLPNCNGTLTWQRSLVLAIQQASPLPAPPSPTVFSRTITLSFVGYEYSAGGSEEGYETQSEAIARAASAHGLKPADLSAERPL